MANHETTEIDVSVPTFFYTRFGVGVSDTAWIDYRLRLFQAVTLPSVARHLNDDIGWIIVIDENMDRHAKKRLEALTSKLNVKILPVVAFPQAAYKARSVLPETGDVRLIRIDDDDAISDDFMKNAPARRGVHTMPAGFETDLAQRVMRPVHRPFLSLNTIYQGPVEHTQKFLSIGHHAIERLATKYGLDVTHVQTPQRVFMYSRHKQSDSHYPAVARAIKEDDQATPLSPAWRRRFGFDEELFREWRQFARTAPKKPKGSVWKKTQDLNNEASQLIRRLYEINTEVRDITRNIFE